MTPELAQLQQQYDRLNLLYQVGQIIHSTLDPQEALELVLREAVRLTRATSGSIVLFNPTAACWKSRPRTVWRPKPPGAPSAWARA